MKVIKRNGITESFNINKIVEAVAKAVIEVDGSADYDFAKSVGEKVKEKCLSQKMVSVEDIQNYVEEILMESNRKDIARAYVRYRYERELARQRKTDKAILNMIQGMDEYWSKENSNKNAELVTVQRDYLAGITSTDIAKNYIFPKDIIKAHEEGIVHQHDMDYLAQNTLHNCFLRDTRFITKEGMRSFNDFNDGDIIEVLSIDGQYHKAKVKQYGTQPLYKYTFYSGKKEYTHEIIATENHRWILKDGTETTALSVGDKLCKAPVIYPQNLDWDTLTHTEQLMWCKGFGLGDGTKEYGTNSTRIRLCEEKDLQYLNRFTIDGCSIRNTKFNNEDREVVIYNYRKTIPEFASIKELQCFINGLYCADGRKKQMANGKYNFSLQSSSLEVINFLREKAGTAGLYITRENERTGEITNFTSSKGRPYTVLFSFNNDFYFNYTVLNKEFYGEDNVWCLEVEDTHNFILEYGIPTGNCELINLEDMLQNGTVVNNVKINKPHKLITAMTITTQIMASVAANSYGGESISLAHLAPFVRNSYNLYLEKYKKYNLDEETVKKLAKEDLNKEIIDAVQTFNYQLSTLFTLNGQSPFASVFIYLNENPDYKEEIIMLAKEIFKQRMEGMPNRDGIKITQAFPKILYVLQEDNYKPGTKYWDLTKLAVECSSKRLTPDYISEKVMKELKINGNGEGDCYACIKCPVPYISNGISKSA